MAWHDEPTTNPEAKVVAAQLRSLAAAIEREGAAWEVQEEREVERNSGGTPRYTGWRTISVRVLARESHPVDQEPAAMGDIVRIYDRLDRTWLGVVRDTLAYEGYPVYVCDLWRIEDGAVVRREGDRFNASEFEVALRAREQGVGR